MFDYIGTLMCYMQRNGIEDFANPGVDHKIMKQIVMAIRKVALVRENTPLSAEEYSENVTDDSLICDYQLTLPGNIYLKCKIEYGVYKKSHLTQPVDAPEAMLCIFWDIQEMAVYDEDGNLVTTFDADDFTYLVRKAMHSVYDGERVERSQLDYASDFSEGLALVYYNLSREKTIVKNDPVTGGKEYIFLDDGGTKYTFINRKGEFVFPDKWFDSARNFKDGIAEVRMGKEKLYIDKSGNVIDPPAEDDTTTKLSSYNRDPYGLGEGYRFHSDEDDDGNEILFLEKPDGECVQLEVDIYDQYNDYTSTFSEGLLLALTDEEYILHNPFEEKEYEPSGCCIDSSGKLRYYFDPFERIPVSGYSNGYAIFHYLIDDYAPEEDPEYDPEYDPVHNDWKERYQKYKGYGYVDREGNLAIDMLFSEAHPFKDGLARVRILGRLVFIDTEGKIVF